MFHGLITQPKTKRVIMAVTLLALAALLAACGTGGSSLGGVTTAEVSGTVKDADTGTNLDGVTVRVVGNDEWNDTSTNGAFTISNVRTGIRTITAERAGYHTWQQNDFLVRSGINIVNIEMESLDEPENLLTGTVYGPAGSLAYVPNSAWDRLMAFVGGPVAQAQLSGETAVAGATVQAYNWETGKPVGEVAMTGADGSFTLVGVTYDITVVIIVTKDDLRLSYIVPKVEPDTEVEINTLSTFIAEILGSNFGMDQSLDSDEYNNVTGAVEDLIEDLDIAGLDLRPGAGWLSDKFGGSQVNSDLRDIRDEYVKEAGHIAQAQRLIGVLRNTWPTLLTLGTPIIGDVSAEIDETITPILTTVTGRMGVIATLVAEADLEWDQLQNDKVFTFTGDGTDYQLITTINSVTMEGDDNDVKHVKSTFVVVVDPDDNDETPIASGSMDFKQKNEQPVSWMDIEVIFAEEGEEEITELALAAEVDFVWRLEPDPTFGDYRDLEQIVIKARDISGGGDDATELMTASGTLTASMDTREWVDGEGHRIAMPSSFTFTDGTIVIPNVLSDLDATLNVTKIQFTLEEDDESFDRDHFTLNADVDVYIGDTNDPEIRFTGTFNTNGIHISSGPEGPGTGEWGDMASEFTGIVEVGGRPPLTITFKTNRTGKDEIGIQDGFTIIAEGVTFTGIGSVTVQRGAEYNDFVGAVIDVELTHEDNDENEYVIDVKITLKEGNLIDVEGDVTLGGTTRLALITSEEYDVPTVIYDPDNPDAGEWYTESLF